MYPSESGIRCGLEMEDPVGIKDRTSKLGHFLHRDAPLYTLLQVLSLTLFEKMPILQALSPRSSSWR
jgi:hypothetical protein